MRDPRVSKVGIGAPLGWPLAFIDAFASYRDAGTWIAVEANELRFRATEIVVAQETGQNPLSVAISDLAWAAMCRARLLTELARRHEPIDRTGAGRVAEVYPAAALRRWELVAAGPVSQTSYKRDGPNRHERHEKMMNNLASRPDGRVELPPDDVADSVEDDDALDALISCLMARAIEQVLTNPIPRGMQWQATREGWIHVPTHNSLEHLDAVAVVA